MTSSEPPGGRIPPISPRVISLGTAVVIALVTFVGPDAYYGVPDETIGLAILAVFLAWFVVHQGRSTDGDGVGDPTTPPAVGEHYRATGETVEPGVYRVVGAGDPVALLQVGDEQGRRVTTGELVRVDTGELGAAFEGATDPAAGFSAVTGVRNVLSGLYWSVRKFV